MPPVKQVKPKVTDIARRPLGGNIVRRTDAPVAPPPVVGTPPTPGKALAPPTSLQTTGAAGAGAPQQTPGAQGQLDLIEQQMADISRRHTALMQQIGAFAHADDPKRLALIRQADGLVERNNQLRRKRDALREIIDFDALQMENFERLRAAAAQAFDVEKARQLGSVQRNVGMAFQARGLGEIGEASGLEGQGIIAAETALGALAAGNLANFDMDLLKVLQADRAGFIRGQFDFFKELQRMRFATDLQLELLQAQHALQGRESIWGSVLTALGAGIGSIFGGGGGDDGGGTTDTDSPPGVVDL